MKYILVWWLIQPGHMQHVHMESYLDATSCEARANDLLIVGNIHAKCSRV